MSAAAKQGDFGLYWAACRMHGVPIEAGSGSQVLQGTVDRMLAACPFLLQLPLLITTPASGKLKHLVPAYFVKLRVRTYVCLNIPGT